MLQQNEIRALKILYMLLETDCFLTISKIAKHFGLSKRTIQTDLEKLEKLISVLGISDELQVEKKSGCGIRADIKSDNTELIKRKIKIMCNSVSGQKDNEHEDYEHKNYIRHIETLRMLINSTDELTIQFLADQFYVSKSVVLKDLEWINIWLSKFHLKVYKRQHRGICIVGPEKNRRNALVEFHTLSSYENADGLNMKDNIAFNSADYRINEKKYSKMKRIYPKVNIEKISDIIRNAEKEFDFFMPDEHYESLFMHLLIGIDRILKGSNVDEEDGILYEQFGETQMQVAEYIASQIEKEFATVMPRAERAYICMHLMGSELYNISDEADASGVVSSIPMSVKDLANDLIDYIGKLLSYDFKGDTMLLFGLLFHLKTSVYRLKNNFSFKSFDDSLVKLQYPKVYQSVFTADVLYEKHCKVLLTADEIMAITLHFALAMERIKHKNKVIFVSNGGVASNVSICESIKRLFQDINIVDICNQYQLGLKDESEFDFIIANIPIKHHAKPVIKVSSNLEHSEIEEIERHIYAGSGAKRCKPPMEQHRVKTLSFEISPKNEDELFVKAAEVIQYETKCMELLGNVKPEIRRTGKEIILGDTLWMKVMVRREGVFFAANFKLNPSIIAGNENVQNAYIFFVSEEGGDFYTNSMQEVLKVTIQKGATQI
ncbi:MAG: transcriptional antiterminator [Bacillota bacterium]|jgi:transcriptional antiterminator|nr:transcriptional antiterminator [Bacillota bacterium]